MIILIALITLSIALAGCYFYYYAKSGEENAVKSEKNNLFNSGLVSVKVGDNWGFINETGEYVINPQFDYVYGFNDGLARVKSGDKYGYINTKGEYVINPQFDSVNDFSEGLALVESGDKYGYINTKGDIIINYLYIQAYSFYDDGYAVVATTDKKYVIIGKDGKQIGTSFDGIDGHTSSFCREDGCYEETADEYCSSHDEEEYVPYCRYYSCYNRAYSGSYCYDHNYLE